MHGTYGFVNCVAIENVQLVYFMEKWRCTFNNTKNHTDKIQNIIRLEELWKDSQEMRVSEALGLQLGTLNESLLDSLKLQSSLICEIGTHEVYFNYGKVKQQQVGCTAQTDRCQWAGNAWSILLTCKINAVALGENVK